MKKIGKNIVVNILGWQVRRLRRKNNFKIIAVAGSSGKTSTKFAVANFLSAQHKVRFQEGNYNDITSVPLVFFGHVMPDLLNPLAWIRIFISNEKQLKKAYPYDVVVLELGPDGPGQMTEFKKYLQADIGILTAIAPEHMEFFGSLDAVAKEEKVIAGYSDKLLVNADLCDGKYLSDLPDAQTYGMASRADYRIQNAKFIQTGYEFTVTHNDSELISAFHESVSAMHLYSLCAAIAAGHMLGMEKSNMKTGLKTIKPVSGRMQVLKGIKELTILDDTYNASPRATIAALDTLYQIDAPHKIALLGNMNELGDYSEKAHTEVGEYCDPAQLELVVTIGPDANKYLAKAAERKGCRVKACRDAIQAAELIREHLKPKTVLLAKGSQNGVYAEEAVKILLADLADASKLVRQSPAWLAKK